MVEYVRRNEQKQNIVYTNQMILTMATMKILEEVKEDYSFRRS